MIIRALSAAFLVLAAPSAFAQTETTRTSWPNQREGDFIIKDFRFKSGETIAELKQHYMTLGTAKRNAAGEIINAVILLHGTSSTGKAWLMPTLGDELFAAGQALDASQYFIILPDGIGRGGSSKPSDGLRAKFPHFRYEDIIAAEHQLVTEGLGIKHLRLVMGSSMGGMHTWMWGYMYPDLMDGLIPIASQPIAISGRNWIQRRIAAEAIRQDPGWNNGNYEKNPTQWVVTAPYGFLQTSNVRRVQELAPTREAGDAIYFKAARRGEEARRQRHAVGHRGGDGLQSRAASRTDQGAADGDQLRRRRDQSAAARRHRARDQAHSQREIRPRPREREDVRPLYPSARRVLEGARGAVPQGAAAADVGVLPPTCERCYRRSADYRPA